MIVDEVVDSMEEDAKLVRPDEHLKMGSTGVSSTSMGDFKNGMGSLMNAGNDNGMGVNNKSIKLKEVIEVIKSNNLGICAVVESHVNALNLKKVCSKTFGEWEWVSNSICCVAGTRIIIGWNSKIFDVMVVSQSNQVIHCYVRFIDSNYNMYLSFIYAATNYIERRNLWDNLVMHRSVVKDYAWGILGDFNVAMKPSEYSECSSRIPEGVADFIDCINNIEVEDINCTGFQFTWTKSPNGNKGIMKKLDRVMANLKFMVDFPMAQAVFKPYRISDHCPAILNIPMCKPRWKPSFRFANFIAGKEEFLPMDLRRVLDIKQGEIDMDPFNVSLKEEHTKILFDFNEACEDEEKILFQRSKINWLKEGDKNSRFFHKVINSRRNKSRISLVLDEEGRWVSGKAMKDRFVNHFKSFFGTDVITEPINVDNGLICNKLDSRVALDMIRVVKDEEIKAAMFDIDDNRAPSPDGFHLNFLKMLGVLLGLRKVTDFRPIACCNTIYKCISKIIANRIRGSLGDIVDINQSAFIPGRSILENILLAQELMVGYKRKMGAPKCALKIDIQKAYDTVDWKFLKQIRIGFGFHSIMVQWIMACVLTHWFMLSINGEDHGYFEGKRGLRQGDPLSPYLFTIVMEIFNLILKKNIEGCQKFKYHSKCKPQRITHLCFADDLLVFCYGNSRSARVIKDSLDEFKNNSGLNVSMEKSQIFFSCVKPNMRRIILGILPFEFGMFPFKYLGVPMSVTKLFSRDFFKIPVATIKEIEKMCRSYLWCNGEVVKGKAKVSWSIVCTPKECGGLGVKDLRKWNDALLAKHVWNVVKNKNSLWVRWVHNNYIRDKNFGDIMYKKNMNWTWKRFLDVRKHIRFHVVSSIGNGENTSIWHDWWHPIGILSAIISRREWLSKGFNDMSKVCDIMVNDHLTWPSEWVNKFPGLKDGPMFCNEADQMDKIIWRDKVGSCKQFSCKQVWIDINNFGFKVPWCEYANQIWRYFCKKIGVGFSYDDWNDLIIKFCGCSKGKSVIKKLVLAGSVAHIWMERNARLFRNVSRPYKDVIHCIEKEVQLKMIGMKLQLNMMHGKVCKKWGIKGMDNLHKGSDINVNKRRTGVVNCFWWSLGLVLRFLGDLIGLWWRYTIIWFKSEGIDGFCCLFESLLSNQVACTPGNFCLDMIFVEIIQIGFPRHVIDAMSSLKLNKFYFWFVSFWIGLLYRFLVQHRQICFWSRWIIFQMVSLKYNWRRTVSWQIRRWIQVRQMVIFKESSRLVLQIDRLQSEWWWSEGWKNGRRLWIASICLFLIHRAVWLFSSVYLNFGLFRWLIVKGEVTGWSLRLVYWTVGFFKGLALAFVLMEICGYGVARG
ncbi:unnamed protein product [Lactuca virosa]|uniref:Reverse transcriptase domain-containing protein n=1 Tax=Lactuca virosa TaxID=75947 RepID=A0AAU9PCZ9_9ASTR|nr:unnamed protein product [Lactuca virosa]